MSNEKNVNENAKEKENKINKKYIVEKVKTHKKILLLLGSIFFSYILPLVIVSFKFGLFEKETGTAYKITGISLLVIVVLVIKFYGYIKKTINERIKNHLLKKIIMVARNVLIVVIAIVLIEALKESLLTLEILAIVLAVSFSLGNWLDEDYKKCLEKDEKWKSKQEMLNTLREFEEEKTK